MFGLASYARPRAWSVLWKGRRGWRGLVDMLVEVRFDEYLTKVRSLTLLLKRLDDVADSLHLMLARLLSHWMSRVVGRHIHP